MRSERRSEESLVCVIMGEKEEKKRKRRKEEGIFSVSRFLCFLVLSSRGCSNLTVLSTILFIIDYCYYYLPNLVAVGFCCNTTITTFVFCRVFLAVEFVGTGIMCFSINTG